MHKNLTIVLFSIIHICVGEGVSKDAHSAEQWFLFAASRGHEGAKKNLVLLDKQRNIQLGFVIFATVVLGFFLTMGITGYGGDFFKALIGEEDVELLEPGGTSPAVPNPGFFSSSGSHV
jgi:TPR repeat protein